MSLLSLSHKLVHQFKQAWSVWLPAWLPNGLPAYAGLNRQNNRRKSRANNTHQPLLSANEMLVLADELALITQRLAHNPKLSDALRQGEQSSRFMGGGLEYEESRPYEMGDEIRRINWRLMAKTGQVFTKLYQEERQESWVILVDQRQSMRFGTRVRLKATQAARVAGYFAWLAQQGGIPVMGARLAASLTFTPTFEGRGAYTHLMESFAVACPPMTAQEARDEPHINDVLMSLRQQVRPGSRLMLISDFHDANSNTTEILTALQQNVLLKAVVIQDPAELELPNLDGLQLQSVTHQAVHSFVSASQRATYQAWSNAYHQQLFDTLRQAGVEPIVMRADAPTTAFGVLQGELSTAETAGEINPDHFINSVSSKPSTPSSRGVYGN